MIVCKVKTIVSGFGKIPVYKTELSAGADLYAANVHDVTLEPLQRAVIPSGIRIELPEDAECQIRPRSGFLFFLFNQTLFLGFLLSEVGIMIVNLGSEPYIVKRGERIAQAVFNGAGGLFQADFIEVENFTRESERGEGGFGHTGKN